MAQPLTLYDDAGHARYLDPRELGAGGEAIVYTCVGTQAVVAKVYKKEAGKPTPQTGDKLRWMVRNQFPDVRQVAAWPIATLHDTRGGSPVGFLMPRFSGKHALQLFNTSERWQHFPEADWAFLVQVAERCAAAFEIIHRRGLLVGDVNPKNVLVDTGGRVALIDCDSFQVEAGGRVLVCEVGFDEYTPPELQGRDRASLPRTLNQDRWALAVLVFHLLFVGRHPYGGVPSDDVDLAIRDFQFAFSEVAPGLRVKPPPGCPRLSHISRELARLFERAFNRGSEAPDARPTAAEWRAALADFGARLGACGADPGHKFFRLLRECTWCALVRAGDLNHFPGHVGIVFLLDRGALTELWQRVEQAASISLTPPRLVLSEELRTVTYPGPRQFKEKWTPLEVFPAVLPAMTYYRPPPSRTLMTTAPLPEVGGVSERAIRIIIPTAAAGLLLLVSGLCLSVPLLLVGLAILCAVAVSWAILVDRTKARRAAEHARRWEVWNRVGLQLAEAEAEWQRVLSRLRSAYESVQKRELSELRPAMESMVQAEDEWRQAVARYNAEFLAEKRHQHEALDTLVKLAEETEAEWHRAFTAYCEHSAALKRRLGAIRDSYLGLQAKYDADRQELEQRAESLCRDQFLMTQSINDYEIPDIGPKRKRLLAYYGITSAYDVREEAFRDYDIKGFKTGKFKAALLNWKESLLARFRFDPAAGVPRRDLERLVVRYRQLQASLLAELERGASQMEARTRETQECGKAIESHVQELHRRLRAHPGEAAAVLNAITGRAEQRIRSCEARVECLRNYLGEQFRLRGVQPDRFLHRARQELAPVEARIQNLVDRLAQAIADLDAFAQQ